MFSRDSANRLDNKSPMHAIKVELQQGYAQSVVKAKALAHRLQQLVDEQTGYTRSLDQIIYQAIDIYEPPSKPLDDCRTVAVQLTLLDQANAELLARGGSVGLHQVRVLRLVNEALIQGGHIVTSTNRRRTFSLLQDKELESVMLRLFIDEFGYDSKVIFAQAMPRRILEILEAFMEPCALLKPEQLLGMAVANDGKTHAGQRMRDIPQVPVVLDLIAKEDLQAVLAEYSHPLRSWGI